MVGKVNYSDKGGGGGGGGGGCRAIVEGLSSWVTDSFEGFPSEEEGRRGGGGGGGKVDVLGSWLTK